MKPFLAAALAALALVGCNGNRPEGRSEVQRQLAVMDPMLTHSNVSEFDEQVAIAVNVELVGGNTVVTIPPGTSWPVGNAFLGFDQFFYTANPLDHPIIRVKDQVKVQGKYQACDEPVVGGQACGWTVNFDGCEGDGFGCFASRKSGGPASHGASTQPLVFVLLGEADFTVNDHGSTFAVHGRFDNDCSGWFSDGVSSGKGSNPACVAKPPQYSCSLTVAPDALQIAAGGGGMATVTVTETGAPQVPITLSIVPVAPPLPPGLTAELFPNPVNPPMPGTSVLTVGTLSTTPPTPVGQPTQILIKGVGQPPTGPEFHCETTLDLTIAPPPPPGSCVCPIGP